MKKYIAKLILNLKNENGDKDKAVFFYRPSSNSFEEEKEYKIEFFKLEEEKDFDFINKLEEVAKKRLNEFLNYKLNYLQSAKIQLIYTEENYDNTYYQISERFFSLEKIKKLTKNKDFKTYKELLKFISKKVKKNRKEDNIRDAVDNIKFSKKELLDILYTSNMSGEELQEYMWDESVSIYKIIKEMIINEIIMELKND